MARRNSKPYASVDYSWVILLSLQSTTENDLARNGS